jgi:hypothetical protein
LGTIKCSFLPHFGFGTLIDAIEPIQAKEDEGVDVLNEEIIPFFFEN